MNEFGDLVGQFARYVAQHAQQLPSVLWRELPATHFPEPQGMYTGKKGGGSCVPLQVQLRTDCSRMAQQRLLP
jgi:hypothetical protein